MTAATQPRPMPVPWGAILATLYAIVFGAAIVAFDRLAIVGLLGGLFFCVFVRYPVLGLFATTAMLMLQGASGILGTVDGEGTVAVTLAQLTGLAASAAWGINLLIRKRPAPVTWPVVLLVLFCLYALLCTLVSPYSEGTFSHWARLAARLGYFLLAVYTLTTALNFRYFISVMLVCSIVMAATAVVQYVFPTFHFEAVESWMSLRGMDGAYVDSESLSGEAAIRVSGRAGHSNWLALIVLVVLPLNVYWYQTATTRMMRRLIIACVCLILLALVLTFTRTGLLIGIVLSIVVVARRLVRVTPLRVFGGLAFLVVVWIALPEAYKERVLTFNQYTSSRSVQSRIDLQNAALSYAFENPVTGLGVGGFGHEFIKESNKTAAIMKYWVTDYGWQPVFVGAHNLYLQIAADLGFVGLAIFLAFYLLLIKRLLAQEETYRINGDLRGVALTEALLVSMLSFALCGVFLHALHQEIWWMVTAAATALVTYRFDFRATPKQIDAPAEARPV